MKTRNCYFRKTKTGIEIFVSFGKKVILAKNDYTVVTMQQDKVDCIIDAAGHEYIPASGVKLDPFKNDRKLRR